MIHDIVEAVMTAVAWLALGLQALPLEVAAALFVLIVAVVMLIAELVGPRKRDREDRS